MVITIAPRIFALSYTACPLSNLVKDYIQYFYHLDKRVRGRGKEAENNGKKEGKGIGRNSRLGEI